MWLVSTFYDETFSYHRCIEKIVNLQNKYNIYAKVIGTSVLGRKIYALPVGKNPSNILYVGGVHGMEWLTSHLLFRFCEDILYCDQNQTPLYHCDVHKLLATKGAYIVPFINPDGICLQVDGIDSAGFLPDEIIRSCDGDFSHWQANAHGVDLNHNFDAGFEELKLLEYRQGITAPCATRFGGSSPLSEPESDAIADFILSHDIQKLYAFHSQGEEIFYQYGASTPPASALIAHMLAKHCGYTVTTPTGTASHGGLKDWFVACLGRSGFTFEIGKGENPLPIGDFPAIYAKLQEALFLSLML